MAEKNPSFETANQEFESPNSRPARSSDTRELDEESKQRILEENSLLRLELERERTAIQEEIDRTVASFRANPESREANVLSEAPSIFPSAKAVLENMHHEETPVVFSRFLYFWRLNKETTEQTVMMHFGRFGHVQACSIERDKRHGESKGYGYIVFKLSMAVDDVFTQRRHIIDGQLIKICPISCSKKPLKGRRLFVSIPYGLHEYDLRVYLGRFAQKKVHAYIRKDDTTNITKGYGSVTFKDSHTLHRFMDAAPHFIKGKKVHFDFYGEKSEETLLSRKIQVFHLSDTTTEESFKAYFEKYGAIETSVLMMDTHNLSNSRCGYIIFKWSAAVAAVISEYPHILDGWMVIIVKPKEVNREPEKSRLLTISHLDLHTGEDVVTYYFERYGVVEACLLERDESGKSKGICYVVFQQSKVIGEVMKAAKHKIGNRNVICLPGKEERRASNPSRYTRIYWGRNYRPHRC